MATTIQLKRGALAGLPTLATGEPAFTTDQNRLYVGDTEGNRLMACLNRIGAIGPPGPSNDSTQGYSPLSMWHDADAGEIWLCISNAATAALWVRLCTCATSGDGGPSEGIPEAEICIESGDTPALVPFIADWTDIDIEVSDVAEDAVLVEVKLEISGRFKDIQCMLRAPSNITPSGFSFECYLIQRPSGNNEGIDVTFRDDAATNIQDAGDATTDPIEGIYRSQQKLEGISDLAVHGGPNQTWQLRIKNRDFFETQILSVNLCFDKVAGIPSPAASYSASIIPSGGDPWNDEMISWSTDRYQRSGSGHQLIHTVSGDTYDWELTDGDDGIWQASAWNGQGTKAFTRTSGSGPDPLNVTAVNPLPRKYYVDTGSGTATMEYILGNFVHYWYDDVTTGGPYTLEMVNYPAGWLLTDGSTSWFNSSSWDGTDSKTFNKVSGSGPSTVTVSVTPP